MDVVLIIKEEDRFYLWFLDNKCRNKNKKLWNELVEGEGYRWFRRLLGYGGVCGWVLVWFGV